MKWFTKLRIYCLEQAKALRIKRAQFAAEHGQLAVTSVHLKAVNAYHDRIKSLEASLSR